MLGWQAKVPKYKSKWNFQILFWKSASLSWYFSVEVYKCKCTPSSLGPTSQRVQMRAYPVSIHVLLAQWPSTEKLEDSAFSSPKVSFPPFGRAQRDVICVANELTMFQCKLLITGHCTHLLFNHYSLIAARPGVQCSKYISSFMNEWILPATRQDRH